MTDNTAPPTIWDAKRNLGYDEPVRLGDDLYVDTAPARGDFSLKRLYRDLSVDDQGVLRGPPRKKYVLFTGHRGCGKSTELLRVTSYLHDPARYYVVHLDCLATLDINNLKYSDVLLALAAALLARLRDEQRIDRAATAKAVKQVANDYRRLIGSEDYKLLVGIDRHPLQPDGFTSEKTARMLYDLVLLEYNDYFWKSHPLIATLAGYQAAQSLA